jgi:hypothetical protein
MDRLWTRWDRTLIFLRDWLLGVALPIYLPWLVYAFLLFVFPGRSLQAPGVNNDALLAYALALAIIYLGDPQVQGWREADRSFLRFLAAFMTGIRYVIYFLTIGGLVLLYAFEIGFVSGMLNISQAEEAGSDLAFFTAGLIAAVPAFAASYFVVYTQPSPVPSGKR